MTTCNTSKSLIKISLIKNFFSMGSQTKGKWSDIFDKGGRRLH